MQKLIMLYSVILFQIEFYIFLLGTHFQNTNGKSLNNYNGNLNRYRRQIQNLTVCAVIKFRCGSGECIDNCNLCNGIADCNDKSDESREVCSFINCEINTYRCKYGGCVSREARCNNVQDCWDGSDEESCSVISTPAHTNVTPLVTTGCPFPHNLPHGTFFVPSGFEYKPEDLLPKFSYITLNCSGGYNAIPKPGTAYCIDPPNWFPVLPQKCANLEACPPITTPKSTIVKCSLNGIPLTTCSDAVENTLAHISCEDLYEEPGLLTNPLRLCKGGSWDYPINFCTPICGGKRYKGDSNILNGTAVTISDYPWQAAVYRDSKEFICGGSLINQKIVLSAAHCFCSYDGIVQPKENYLIAVGKSYYNYEDERDTNAQYSEVAHIYVPNRYKGITNYFESDIAVIILSTPFQLSLDVGLVCIDLNTENDLPYFDTDGIVTGWGVISQNNQRVEELRGLSIPYIPFDKCFSEVSIDFRRYITHDKICGGYLDQGKAVCSGGGGSALVFPQTHGLYHRYYVKGIASTSPGTHEATCDLNSYGTYTSIAKHVTFIRDLVVSHRQV